MATEVRDNPEQHRYEIYSDGALAGFAKYHKRPGALVFTHTEVDERYAGQGLGSALARGALDDVKANGLHAVPQCPFIARYLRTHAEYADLLPPDTTHGSS